MSRFLFILTAALFAGSTALAQPSTQFTPDSLTRALWHFNEASGSIVHDTAAYNDGVAYGTIIVPGRFGNGRLFNGTSDYVSIPSSAAFDFDTSSFSVDVWFKTTQASGIIIRRGLAPEPGFCISTLYGHVVGMIGNRSDFPWPNALLSDTSTGTYNDNMWHIATLVRDRVLRKLLLYVDGVPEGQPADDNFTIPLNSGRPLTIGCWETYLTSRFAGLIDEVRISGLKPATPTLAISVQPMTLGFGLVRARTVDTLSLQIRNLGSRDSLRVTSISATNPHFGVSAGAIAIPPYGSYAVTAWYAPAASQVDTGTITIASNDPSSPTVRIAVSGRGYALMDKPLIKSIALVPNTNGQALIAWFRSKYDSVGAADPVTEYSVWEEGPENGVAGPANSSGANSPLSPGPTWVFIQTVPAIGLDQYGLTVQVPYPYSGSSSWQVFMIVAQTRNLAVYMSAPDSIRADPGFVTGINGSAGIQAPKELTLKQNYPNPFNPSTIIRYGLPARTTVSLAVYNALGQAVATLVDGEQEAGYHEVRFDGTNLASGVYFCRLKAASSVRTSKLLLVR